MPERRMVKARLHRHGTHHGHRPFKETVGFRRIDFPHVFGIRVLDAAGKAQVPLGTRQRKARGLHAANQGKLAVMRKQEKILAVPAMAFHPPERTQVPATLSQLLREVTREVLPQHVAFVLSKISRKARLARQRKVIQIDPDVAIDARVKNRSEFPKLQVAHGASATRKSCGRNVAGKGEGDKEQHVSSDTRHSKRISLRECHAF